MRRQPPPKITNCDGCGAAIVFLQTERGRMPVNAETVDPNDREFMPKKHVSHFAGCPKAEQFRRGKAPATHPCHWPNCPKRVARERLMCREHWTILPKDIRNAIYRGFRKGVESPEYEAALAAVDDFIQHHEAP